MAARFVTKSNIVDQYSSHAGESWKLQVRRFTRLDSPLPDGGGSWEL